MMKSTVTTKPKRGRPNKSADPFLSAQKAATDRLEAAIKERAEAMAKTAMLNVEIPLLTETVRALQNQMKPTVIKEPSPFELVGSTPQTVGLMQYASPDLTGVSSIPAPRVAGNVLEIPESGELPEIEDSL